MMLWGVLFGSIGMGYFIYGKRQSKLVPLCIGIALCIFPYFMTGVTMLLIVGVVSEAKPWSNIEGRGKRCLAYCGLNSYYPIVFTPYIYNRQYHA